MWQSEDFGLFLKEFGQSTEIGKQNMIIFD